MKTKKLWLIVLCSVAFALVAGLGYRSYLERTASDYFAIRDFEQMGTFLEGRKSLATTLLDDAFVAQDKEAFLLLLKKGADPHKSWVDTRWGPETLFAQVAGHEDSFWIEQIMKHGANPNRVIAPNRVYPLTITIERHRPKNAELLIEHGADVNSRVRDCSQIDFAWSQWQHQITYALLTHGADIKARSPLLKSIVGQMQFDFQDKGENLITTSARTAGNIEYLEKILAWFDEQNLDWRNATHSDPTGKTSGVWSIPPLRPQLGP